MYSKKITLCLSVILLFSLLLPSLALAGPLDLNFDLREMLKQSAVAQFQDSLKDKGQYSGNVDGNLDSIKNDLIDQAKGKIGLPSISLPNLGSGFDLKTITETKKDQLIEEAKNKVVQEVAKKTVIDYVHSAYPKVTYLGQPIVAQLTVKNTGQLTWNKSGEVFTYFTYRWLDSTGKAVPGIPEGKVFLPHNVKPGEMLAFNVETTTPQTKGTYTLQVNLVLMDSPITKVSGIAPFKMNIDVLPYGSDNPTQPLPPDSVVIPSPPVDNSTPANSYIIKGRGFGHGVGLSQWGARGMALQNFKYPQILSHYYTGTALQTLPSSNTTVRVGIYLGQSKAGVTTSGPYQIIDGDTQALLASGQKGDSWQVTVNGGMLQATPQLANQGNLFSQTQQTLKARNLIFQPVGDTKLTLTEKKTAYRGSLQFTANLQGKLDVINLVNMEDYLFGVVTKESPSSWPIEALKAQAVASRSYALYKVQLRANQSFDVYDTTTSQVYGGFSGESGPAIEAVLATTGQILTYGNQVVEAVFHANSGGYTENNENIWGSSPLPYLRTVKDEYSGYGTDPVQSRYGFWWDKTYTAFQVENAFNASSANYIGKLISIDIVSKYQSGRPALIKVTGTAGSKTFSNSQFRRILDPNGNNLKSNWFEIIKQS